MMSDENINQPNLPFDFDEIENVNDADLHEDDDTAGIIEFRPELVIEKKNNSTREYIKRMVDEAFEG